MEELDIIGGGLAGLEAASQAARRGIKVNLYDMKPGKLSEGHQSGFLGEMICSNSLGSTTLSTASGLLKNELEKLNSFFLKNGEKCRVSAGNSFSVDRLKLAEKLTEEIRSFPNINYISREINDIPETGNITIIATGPLTSDKLAGKISEFTGRKNLHFYDATSPIVDIESIDMSETYWASRYDKGEPDFLNIPLDRGQYQTLVNDLLESEKTALRDFEKGMFFEACLPVEEIARRGEESLSFGPMKPVGLKDPKTGKIPYAVIQLRQDDVKKKLFQIVGFQTRLTWGEQKKVFRKLPGLKNAVFERYGRMHRNTYINAPAILNTFYQSKKNENIFFAGQISGVEGYLESVCSGLISGINAVKLIRKEPLTPPPYDSACGSLIKYITESNWMDFKPSKFTFGLLPDIKIRGKSKREKKEIKAGFALRSLEKWIKEEKI
ncbi:MAG: methylenetetrahydrofolate--tRNA-(uracil(54)-C(5))-methyltransferase (FADH(2)-oxidizing) TrmFO [Acidobacteriota bacterium]